LRGKLSTKENDNDIFNFFVGRICKYNVKYEQTKSKEKTFNYVYPQYKITIPTQIGDSYNFENGDIILIGFKRVKNVPKPINKKEIFQKTIPDWEEMAQEVRHCPYCNYLAAHWMKRTKHYYCMNCFRNFDPLGQNRKLPQKPSNFNTGTPDSPSNKLRVNEKYAGLGK